MPLREIASVIRRFEKGEVSVVDMQTSIVSNGSAVEGASQALLGVVRSVEADLEFIQHAIVLEDQRSAALEALAPLKRELECEEF